MIALPRMAIPAMRCIVLRAQACSPRAAYNAVRTEKGV